MKKSRIVRPDDLIVGHLAETDLVVVGSGARRDLDRPVTRRFLDSVEDDVFLKNLVLAESIRTRFENVDTAQAHCVDQQLSERFEIRAVTEAARSDCDDFAAGCEEFENY